MSIVNESRAWGGAEVHTAALAETLAGRGHRVRLIEFGTSFLDPRNAAGQRTYDVVPGRPGMSFATASLRSALVALRDLRGDVLLYPRSWFPSANWQFDLAARLIGSGYVTIEHSTCEPPSGASLGDRGRRLLLTVAPRVVVAVSEFSARRLQEVGFGLSKLVVVHNGVDPDRFHPDPVARRLVRTRWGLDDDCLVFGYAGRLSGEKGLSFALAAFARSCATSPHARLVMVGDGSLRSELATAADALGVSSRVRFEAFSSEMHRLYQAFDHFVLPSLTEALPLSLLEAMASGCAVIATTVGGVPEVLPDEAVGWTVPPADVDALARAMTRALALSPADRAVLGARARQRVIDAFDARRQMSSLVDLLEQRLSAVH